MKNIYNIFRKKVLLEPDFNKEDVIKFYLQLLKMKKKRPHMNTINLLKKCYPNATKFIDDLVNTNGNRTIGEYDDEINELRIVLFSYFKSFLDGLDDFSELTKDEKEVLVKELKNIYQEIHHRIYSRG